MSKVSAKPPTASGKVAAIDVGSERMHVAIHEGPVQVFDTMTDSLCALRDFLKAQGVVAVAMEATGVYWLVIYEVLEQAGLEVVVVNGAHVKNVPGRKTDMSDCQWLAQVHAMGLLRAAFVPPERIRVLRDYQRLRQDHVRMGGQHIQHMQKALDRMNLKIHEVLSQTVGLSGSRIIEAVLAGERDPEKLVELCDGQVLKHKRAAMLRALQGHYKDEHLFALRQAYEGWKFYQAQMAACDLEIHQLLEALAATRPATTAQPETAKAARPRKKYGPHNAPEQDLGPLLHRIYGQDLSQLPGLTPYLVMLLLAEVGDDMSRWPTEKHFTAWLGLAPGSRQSGKRRRHQCTFIGPAGRMFCLAARSLVRSKYLALGGFLRRVRGRRGAQVAIIAAARKLAVLFYLTVRRGWNYVEQGLEAYEKKYRQQSIQRLQAAAQVFGMHLMPGP